MPQSAFADCYIMQFGSELIFDDIHILDQGSSRMWSLRTERFHSQSSRLVSPDLIGLGLAMRHHPRKDKSSNPTPSEVHIHPGVRDA
jgi:hypothetical protein